jgi:hypothetical protein
MLKCKDCLLCQKNYWEYDYSWECIWSEEFLGIKDDYPCVGSANNLDMEQECSLTLEQLRSIINLYQGVYDEKKDMPD